MPVRGGPKEGGVGRKVRCGETRVEGSQGDRQTSKPVCEKAKESNLGRKQVVGCASDAGAKVQNRVTDVEDSVCERELSGGKETVG